MSLNRFRNAANKVDPMRVPPDLASRKVPAVQPLRGKLIVLDADDPGYTTEHVLLVTDTPARVLSYAVEMHLITALLEHDAGHEEATAREALAQLVVAHNMRPSTQRTDSEGAVKWLAERLIDMADQWKPSELAQALNERDEVRRQAAREKRRTQMG